MGDRPKLGNVSELVKDRGAAYGESWVLAGRIMGLMIAHAPLRRHGLGPEGIGKYWHPIFLIVTKLCRALWTPMDPDHWRDIQGYAQLVLEDINVQTGCITNPNPVPVGDYGVRMEFVNDDSPPPGGHVVLASTHS